jgi:hypothetical protein
MQIWAMSANARVQIQTRRDGFMWTLDFHLGECVVISRWQPCIGSDGKQCGWVIETWIPKYNRMARDSGAVNTRDHAKKRADILHVVPAREFRALLERL